MALEPQPLSLRSAVRGWWRQNRTRATLGQTLAKFARETWDFVRDSTPDRRRQRYGDVEYDWDHRVDTTSATVGWRDRLLGVFHSPYQPTEPALFREMMQALPIEFQDFIFIDLGSGKGRTLLMASAYPFRRILGVELLPELHRIAQDNARRFAEQTGACSQIETICGDATKFEFPAEPTVLYLFNPLPEAGLREVVGNLEQSLQACPRAVWVLYHNPLLEAVISGSRAFEKVGGTAQYVVYASRGSASKQRG